MRHAELNLAQSALNAMLTHAPDEFIEAMSEWAEVSLLNDPNPDLSVEGIRAYHELAEQVGALFEDGFELQVKFADGTVIKAVDQELLARKFNRNGE